VCSRNGIDDENDLLFTHNYMQNYENRLIIQLNMQEKWKNSTFIKKNLHELIKIV
jgi:predicted ATPase